MSGRPGPPPQPPLAPPTQACPSGTGGQAHFKPLSCPLHQDPRYPCSKHLWRQHQRDRDRPSAGGGMERLRKEGARFSSEGRESLPLPLLLASGSPVSRCPPPQPEPLLHPQGSPHSPQEGPPSSPSAPSTPSPSGQRKTCARSSQPACSASLPTQPGNAHPDPPEDVRTAEGLLPAPLCAPRECPRQATLPPAPGLGFPGGAQAAHLPTPSPGAGLGLSEAEPALLRPRRRGRGG